MAQDKRLPELRKKLTPGWWLSSSHYTQYMIREWTSFFVAVFSLLYIYGLSLWASGSRSGFLDLFRNPGMIVFGVVALVFTMYHAVTWFFLIGKVMPIKVGKTTTTPWQALVLNLILLLIISYAAIWLLVLR